METTPPSPLQPEKKRPKILVGSMSFLGGVLILTDEDLLPLIILGSIATLLGGIIVGATLHSDD